MDRTMKDVAEHMRGIDIAILSTYAANGYIAGRPMSNNGDVEYTGESYYFSFESAHTISEIESNPRVGLGFAAKGGLFTKGHYYVSVEGDATLIRDKSAFEAHWTPSLDKWFEDGIDTPDIVLIKVKARRIHFWDGTEGGEILL